MVAKTHKMFIGGKWVDAADGKTFEDMNPYTREVYAHLPAAKRADANLPRSDVLIKRGYNRSNIQLIQRPSGYASLFRFPSGPPV